MDAAAQLLLDAGLTEPGGKLTLGRGRAQKELRAEVVRELTAQDLLAMQQEAGIQAPALKSLRSYHHTLARTLAQGVKAQEAAMICGISVSRISILKGDPTFMELLTYYQQMEKEQYTTARADMHNRLAGLGFDAVEILHERLIDDPDSFEPKTLLAILEATADRTGHGKTTTVNSNVSHGFSAETLAAIKQNTQLGRPIAQEDREALLCLATERTADEHPEALEVSWEQEGGGSLREEGDPGTEAEAAGTSELPHLD